jgi:hypothetical protein
MQDDHVLHKWRSKMKNILSVIAVSAIFITPAFAETEGTFYEDLQHDRMVLGLSYISTRGTTIDARGNQASASARSRSTQQRYLRMPQPAYTTSEPSIIDAID